MKTQIRCKQHKKSTSKRKTIGPQQKYRLGAVGNINYSGGLNRIYWCSGLQQFVNCTVLVVNLELVNISSRNKNKHHDENQNRGLKGTL